LIDEHRDRPLHRAADLEHLFQHVAARIFEIDQDHVRVDRIDASEQIRGLCYPDDVDVTGFTQAVLQDGGSERALVDNNNL
jgi:hypothetical protein